jgi:predicted nucleic acid-binding Zn ribbon protein
VIADDDHGDDGAPEDPHGPRALGESLDRVARALGSPSAAGLGSVFSHWDDVVGPAVAGHSRPLSLAGGVLVVGVEEPGWHTHLTFLQADLIERVNAVAGPGAVTRLEVRVRRR